MSKQIATATVRRQGNCWYLDGDFIGQLPIEIQTKRQVKEYLQKEADKKWPNKYIVRVNFVPNSRRIK